MADELAPGSMPKMVGQEVRGLASLGYDAEAVVMKSGYPSAYSYHLSGVPIRSLSKLLPPLRLLDMRFPGFSFFSLHHLTSAVASPLLFRKGEWDMVVSLSATTSITAQALKKTRGIPYLAFIATEPFTYILPKIYSERALGRLLPVLMPFASFLQEYILKDCSAVIVYSGKYSHLIREYSDKQVEILPAGCFPISELPAERENFILTYDRWDIGNTPSTFLDVLPRLSREVNLVVAGYWYPSTLKTEFMRDIEKKGLDHRVKVLGPIDEHQIIDLCSRALAHIHPIKEAFGMQSLEAASCGCPIVIPRESGVTDLFEEGIHGYFPPEGDTDTFVESINRIICDPERAKEMGRRAWEVSKQNTWKEHAHRLSRIIEKYVH
jgi:glycosyltransferase involved in cell wall biosynthesis